MANKLLMSYNERRRLVVMEQVISGDLTLMKAAAIMNISYRQAKRLKKRILEKGDEGLIHKSRGRKSNNKYEDSFRKKVIDRYKVKYYDFGPTLASEKLAEEELIVDHETLRRWLISEGLWTRKRKRAKFRQRRMRKKHFGEMIQVDGSHHDWFEGRGLYCCLMNMVDDATGDSYCLFAEHETKEAAMRLLWGWIKLYGIPESLYCDRKNVYITEREPTLEEQLARIEPKTDFGKACDRLGIEILTAYSPQAKGRVERKHGVYQDRLVKEMRLAGISTIEEANRFLHNGYIDKLNKKFAKEPVEKADRHVAIFQENDLRKVFVFEETRTVSNDWIVQYKCGVFQILRENKNRPQPGDKILVHQWLDGSLHFLYKGIELLVEEFGKSNRKEELAVVNVK